jgi:hypothetical protein
MAKKLVRLTEGDLHNIIKESVKMVLREGNVSNYKVFYHKRKTPKKAKLGQYYKQLTLTNDICNEMDNNMINDLLYKLVPKFREEFGPSDPRLLSKKFKIGSICYKIVGTKLRLYTDYKKGINSSCDYDLFELYQEEIEERNPNFIFFDIIHKLTKERIEGVKRKDSYPRTNYEVVQKFYEMQYGYVQIVGIITQVLKYFNLRSTL